MSVGGLVRSTLAGCLLRTSAVKLGKPVISSLSFFINLQVQFLSNVSVRGTSPVTGVAVIASHNNSHISRGWLRYLKTLSETPEPLLRAPPSTGAAPLPSSDTCPTLEALDAHVQHHSYNYTLRHVAEGLITLSILSSLHGASEANAVAPRALPAVATAAQSARVSADPAAVSCRDPLGHSIEQHSISHQIGRAPVAPDGPAIGQVLSEQWRHGVAACARRLSILGQHQMKREVDLGAMALCIKGIGALGVPYPARAELALPFVKRLRDPSYFFSMRNQPPEALISLLYAMGKLRLHRHLEPPDIPSYAQVLERVVKSLMPHVASMSAQDACRVTTALARLGCTSQRREAQLYQEFLQALAAHIASELTAVSPGEAVRLLWAYGILLPASCSQAAGGSSSSSSSSRSSTATARATNNRNSTGSKSIHLVDPAQAGSAVPQMVARLSRVACRSLDVHPPLELVKLVSTLSQLEAQREVEAVLPRATPRLLQALHSLDVGALADVASAYHSSRVHEPGLLQAVADQVVESAKKNPLDNRHVASKLIACYSAGGSYCHPELREMLHHIATEYAPCANTDDVRRRSRSPVASERQGPRGQGVGEADQHRPRTAAPAVHK
ncbi:hypothetical protein Vretimale_652 [Volvox reticuliferus]|uniref:Uncharacterized protein n=1 Tax=Volvox reticuliferus TaxID=1737510 RepID=A0A8J4FDK5_9CHLO|nr:hypothetical protein Vretifemale_2353 [Volvox reticuliferus]GIL94452.1 hypothetical protein Vretimale_652 [Volvox reticuliferus]